MRHASFFDLKAFRKGNKKRGVPHSGISHAYFRIIKFFMLVIVCPQNILIGAIKVT